MQVLLDEIHQLNNNMQNRNKNAKQLCTPIPITHTSLICMYIQLLMIEY